MKIEDNRTEYYREFGDLGLGQCFEYDDNFYMKCGFSMDGSMDGMNAVRLSTGDLISIDKYERVVLLEAKLVIEGAL